MSKPTSSLNNSMQQFQMVMELESLRTEVPTISYSKERAAHITGGTSKMVSKAALFTLALSTGVMMYGTDASAAAKDTEKSDKKTNITQEKSTKKTATKQTKSSTKKKTETKKKIEVNVKSSSKLKKTSSVEKDLKKTTKSTNTTKSTQSQAETKKTKTTKVQEKKQVTKPTDSAQPKAETKKTETKKVATKKTEATKVVVRDGAKTITTKQSTPKATTKETATKETPAKVVTKEVIIPADGQINLDELRANLRKELKLQEKDKLELIVKQQPAVQTPVPVVEVEPVKQEQPPVQVEVEPVKKEETPAPSYQQEAPKKKADKPVKKKKWTYKKNTSNTQKEESAPVQVDIPEVPTTPIMVTPLPENMESRDNQESGDHQVTLSSIFTSLFETPVNKNTGTMTFSLLSLESNKQDNPGNQSENEGRSEGSENKPSPEVVEEQPSMPELFGETRDILALEKSILESETPTVSNETPSVSTDIPAITEPTNENVPSSDMTVPSPDQKDSLIVQGPSNNTGNNNTVIGGQDVVTNQSGKTSTSQDKIGPDAPKTIDGGELPDTASNDLGTAVLGGTAALAGAIYLTRRQRTKTE